MPLNFLNKLFKQEPKHQPTRYSDEIEELLDSAEEGDAQAQYIAGSFFLHGQGVERDLDKAFSLLYQSASQGESAAQFNLALLYSTDAGFPQDLKKSVKWLRLAADQEHVDSQTLLGAAYLNGAGVEVCYEKAFFWTEKAALQGDAQSNEQAQRNLAAMYEKGLGVEKSREKAVYWMKAALSRDPSHEEEEQSSHSLSTDEVNRLVTITNAANDGDVKAQFILGLMYRNGEGVEQDYPSAFFWLKRASDQGHPQATAAIASIEDGSV